MALNAIGNLILCVAFSALAGLGAGFFGVMLSSADKQMRESGKPTRRSRCFQIIGAVGSTCFGLFSIAGLHFGPITLVTIIRAGTGLPSNAFFCQLFGVRLLVKDDYLGTLACVCGVVTFLCFQGPAGLPPTAPQFLRDFVTPWAIAWDSSLMLLFIGSVIILVLTEVSDPSTFQRSRCLGQFGKVISVAILIACASSYMDVAIKGWSAAFYGHDRRDALKTPLFWVAFLTNAFFMVVQRVATVYGSSRCDVLLFVPLQTVLNVFFSIATGMIVLNEGSGISAKGWVGLSFSMISVFGGILMLVHGPAEGHAEAAAPADGKVEEVPTSPFSAPARLAGSLGSAGSVPWGASLTSVATAMTASEADVASEAPAEGWTAEADGGDGERGGEGDEGSSGCESGEEEPIGRTVSVVEETVRCCTCGGAGAATGPMSLFHLNRMHQRAALERARSRREFDIFWHARVRRLTGQAGTDGVERGATAPAVGRASGASRLSAASAATGRLPLGTC